MLTNLDKKLTRRILGLSDNWRPMMSAISFLGEPTVVLTAAVFSYLISAWRGQSPVQKGLVLAVAAFSVNILIKILVHRARPHNLRVETLGIRSYSFPSGHAFGSVIFYGLFAVLDIKYLTRPWNMVLGGLIWLIIFLIGLSRIYLKKHYPTDVLAGWLLGGFSLLIISWLTF